MRTVRTPLDDAIAELRTRPIPASSKGFGPLAVAATTSAASLAAERPGLHDGRFSFPVLTVRGSALRHNTAGMAEHCAAVGVRLAPHGKTTMSPEVAAAQLAAGAWGITVATIGQLQDYRAFAVPRLLLANELVDPAGTAWLAAELRADPGFEAWCCIDSLEGVALLDALLTTHDAGRRLPVLVELGHAGGRTGARDVAAAMAVARAAAATSTLRVAGASGYEGGLGHQRDPATLDAVARFCRDLRELVATAHDGGLLGDDALVSAGGSAFFDVVTRELTTGWPGAWRPQVLLRSGAYVTHDHGHYRDVSPAEHDRAGSLTLRPALELWAPVLSRPEPGLALLGAGRRDMSCDEGMPLPLHVRHRDGTTGPAAGWGVSALNDQHAYLHVGPQDQLGPGDVVCLGISHPCTTIDKWRVVPVVDDEGRVVDALHTVF